MKALARALVVLACVYAPFAQRPVSPLVGNQRVSDADMLAIVKAEDARDPAAVNPMLSNANPAVRYRAALAAGRIGSESSVDALVRLLGDMQPEIRAMAAFAIGEVESIKGADPVIAALKAETLRSVSAPAVKGRLVEAAGKIAAANAAHPKTKELASAILEVLRSQTPDHIGQNELTVRLALTAVLRARPDGADTLVARFLDSSKSRIVADAGNTLARLRSKNANERLRRTLKADPDGAARANAARALGAAEDKDALDQLLEAAMNERDARVRVSAIRAVAALKDTKVVERLIEQGRAYLKSMTLPPSPKQPRWPVQFNELLEIASALGRLLPNTEDQRAITFLTDLSKRGHYVSGEVAIAFAHIAPKAYLSAITPPPAAYREWRQASAYGQGLAAIAATKDDGLIAQAGQKLTSFISGMSTGVRRADERKMLLAMPDLTTAMAALKPNNIDEILRGQLANDDVFIRAAAAGAIAERPVTKENVEALNKAFIMARLTDKHDNDAKLAIMDAVAKLDKRAAAGNFMMALDDPDYLVRKKAFEVLSDRTLRDAYPGLTSTLENARSKQADRVLPYSRIAQTFLGQVLSTDADYRRALSRKNGSVKAVLTTDKGTFTIVFNAEEAPLTVDNFVKLARSGYFNGLEVHRVVPNFVMQDGDPRGDGNGGPGWSIRCEVNMLEYDRGAVGMALSGKDTGGSQWFVTHSPQPHLDGGYTVFGHVSENDMEVVDKIVRGDRIIRVQIIGRVRIHHRETENTEKKAPLLVPSVLPVSSVVKNSYG